MNVPKSVKELAKSHRVVPTPYPGYYITDHGEVISTVGPPNPNYHRINPKYAHKLKPIKLKNGYLSICVYTDKGIKMYLIHRLVLESFVGPCPEGYIACHYDDDKTNNKLANLRWDTYSANMNDRRRNGILVGPRLGSTSVRGEQHGNSVLTTAKVKVIKQMMRDGFDNIVIAKKFKVARQTINSIRRGDSWAWLE